MSSSTGQDGRTSFTGRTFSRKPRRTVLVADTVARRLITLSGIGSIVAVSLVGLFLVWVVLPLLAPTSIETETRLEDPGIGEGRPGAAGARVLAQVMDEYGSMVWTLTTDGRVAVRGLEPGQELPGLAVTDSLPPTAFALAGSEGRAAFGFADGTIVTARLTYAVEFLSDDEAPARYHDLPVGETAVWGEGVVTRTPEGQLRHQTFSVERDDPVALADTAVTLLDLTRTPSGVVLAALDAAGRFHQRTLTWKTNLLTGKRTLRTRGGDLDLVAAGVRDVDRFEHLLVNDTGDLVLLVEGTGRTVLVRRGRDGFAVTRRQDLTPEAGVRIAALAFLGGRASLAVGDDGGGLSVWFQVRDAEGHAAGLTRAHVLEPGPAAVTALGASQRSRMVAAGYADGTVRLYHVTSHRLLGEDRQAGNPPESVTISPREDLLLVTGPAGATLYAVDAPHPETSLGTLFGKVWYEGYDAPAYVWQSSAAEDTFEPKMSLVPLIFGTLKATFYSLLFGLPLALLAAMYTSEFLDKRTRARVKPVIEIMASLPSVVLGFLAALVVAPFVEDVVVQVLAVIVLSPFFVLLGAHLWQLLPREAALRLESWRPVAVLASLTVAVLVLWPLGPSLERAFFGGDVRAWLDGRLGSGVIGWLVLLLPACGLVVGWVNMTWGEGVLRRRRGWSRPGLAGLDLVRFLAAAAATFALALAAGWLLQGLGWDPRGSVLGTYVQRNALVVGIAMGFAVIPIIYTISEDALTAVPDHLRAASLGAGATPWQTMILVIVPPAMSGLFSAAMIGLGRAVGETMIVLMAAGNTPIMDMNIFNGFRTLSANLAVELPEAVQNSTHYRTLFLAALTLFVMTFILNTVAEAVRLHFRGKASRL